MVGSDRALPLASVQRPPSWGWEGVASCLYRSAPWGVGACAGPSGRPPGSSSFLSSSALDVAVVESATHNTQQTTHNAHNNSQQPTTNNKNQQPPTRINKNNQQATRSSNINHTKTYKQQITNQQQTTNTTTTQHTTHHAQHTTTAHNNTTHNNRTQQTTNTVTMIMIALLSRLCHVSTNEGCCPTLVAPHFSTINALPHLHQKQGAAQMVGGGGRGDGAIPLVNIIMIIIIIIIIMSLALSFSRSWEEACGISLPLGKARWLLSLISMAGPGCTATLWLLNVLPGLCPLFLERPRPRVTIPPL